MNCKILFTLVTLFVSSTIFSQDPMFDVCPLKVGEKVPEGITVTDDKGKAIVLDQFLKEKPTVLIFFRGGWCGYCSKHLADIKDAKKDIEKLGYQLVGITSDEFNRLVISEEKASTEYTMLSDNNVEAITAFGLGWQLTNEQFEKYKNSYKIDVEEWSGGKTHHTLPVPAVYIIEDGEVKFNYVNPNYSIRLKAKSLLSLLESLKD